MRPWFCVQCIPRQEYTARQQLEQQGFTVFWPTFLVKLKDRHIKVKPLFSNYLFVSFAELNYWPRINNTHGVARILTYQPEDDIYQRPSSIASDAIESLRSVALSYDEVQRGGKRPPQRQYITAGCYVKVLDGVLKDEAASQRALVDWADHERAFLLLDMFNRKVRVEFYQRDLQRVA